MPPSTDKPRGGSQQGCIILLGDQSMVFNEATCCTPMAWSLTRIHRVVRSTLAAEAAAMATSYDAAVSSELS
eukprot:12919318-Prorocentrum_lima.AAC.1